MEIWRLQQLAGNGVLGPLLPVASLWSNWSSRSSRVPWGFMVRTQKVARGCCAWCPDHSKHSVRQALQQLLPLRACNPSRLPPSAAADTPAPTHSSGTRAPTPRGAVSVEPKPSRGMRSSGSAPRAGHDTPSSWRPPPQRAVLTGSPAIQRVCSIAPCLCPSPGALPAPHHLLPPQALLLCPGHSAGWEARAGQSTGVRRVGRQSQRHHPECCFSSNKTD